MADPAVQDLLGRTHASAQILLRVNTSDASKHSYYVRGGAAHAGRCVWVDIAAGASDAARDSAIRAALAA